MTGTATVIQANAHQLPIPDNTVDLVVTSPPYFALRSYQDGGEHYAGQIGDEPTPSEFVASLLDVTRECVRVLKPSGSLWVNLGDKYVADNRGSGMDAKRGDAKHAPRGPLGYITGGMRQKSLMGIPWRYALACIDDLGLILRAEVIWSKPNGLPESVTDRVRRSHEQWFHFTLNPRYFSAVDEIREGYAPGTAARYASGYKPEKRLLAGYVSTARDRSLLDGDTGPGETNPLGKLPGSVWTVPTEPLRVPDHLGVDHFAAFPTEWPKRIIQGWSPAGVCVACGEGRRPVTVSERTSGEALRPEYGAGNHGKGGSTLGPRGVVATITGYACACPEPMIEQEVTEFDYDTEQTVTRTVEVPDPSWINPAPITPGVVLDPFGGTGTTAMVAKALGRHGISVDLSHDYCRLAEWRTNDRNQLAKVLGIAKTEQQPDTQGDLFDLLGGEPA